MGAKVDLFFFKCKNISIFAPRGYNLKADYEEEHRNNADTLP
jgi:hypothetical protein